MSRRVRSFLTASVLAAAGMVALPSASAAADAPATVWACLPGVAPNPCEGSLATTYLTSTVLQPRKVAKVETPPVDAERPVDCFYVYPTVVSLPRTNAPNYVTSEVKSILEYQASRFSQVCRVFAPVYRQATLFGILSSGSGDAAGANGETAAAPAFALGYADVKRAWNEYLATKNDGRGVVLIGHSQGSGMLTRLLREEIDPSAEQRAKLVAAIVPGGNLTVKQGERTGGDLDQIPVCATAAETGCALAWSLYASAPTKSAFFGRTASSLRAATGLPLLPGTEVVCTNPAELSGDGGRFETFTRSERFPGLIGAALQVMYFGLPPRANTPWISPGERYRASCRRTRNGHVLLVRTASPGAFLPLESPWPDWGLHLADVNLPLGNLVRLVREKSAAYAAANG
ncbi:MAG: DUF3089 domain-containing protein [Solirubrobacteraceae bacterium]|nr:DUF3089 domain-containing protein [Solirubrobacteraceae bacterium]